MKIAVGMSGGVDSSVAAHLLKEEGHEVVGVTLKLWGGLSDQGCCSVSDVEDARYVANKLGIEHHVWGFTEEFSQYVVDPYVYSHSIGETPNPCIECNKKLKFDAMISRALRLEFDAIATGHYAIKFTDKNGKFRLRRSVDRRKDQSYVLSGIKPAALEYCMFPLGSLHKEEVRKIANSLGFITAEKPDSQDICFILATGGREQFLKDRIEFHSAKVIDDETEEVIGEVRSLEMITVGQRRFLGEKGDGRIRYALKVDNESRSVRVGPIEKLMDNFIELRQTFFYDVTPKPGDKVRVQTSAHGDPKEAVWLGESRIELLEPIRRVAVGQTVAIYDGEDGEDVLGSGMVSKCDKSL